MPELQKIQFRRDTAAGWTAANPVLSAGTPGFETDTGKLKLGDGTKDWKTLPYVGGSMTLDQLGTLIHSAPEDAYPPHSNPPLAPHDRDDQLLVLDSNNGYKVRTVRYSSLMRQTAAMGFIVHEPHVAYTAAADEFLVCDASTAPFTVTLPAGVDYATLTVKKNDTSANAVTVQRAGTDVFNTPGGVSSLQLTIPGQTMTFRFKAGVWHVLNNSFGPTALMDVYAPKRTAAIVDAKDHTALQVVPDANITPTAHNHVTVANSFNNTAPACPTIGVDGTSVACELALKAKGAGRPVSVWSDGARVATFLAAMSSAKDYLEVLSNTGAVILSTKGASASVPLYVRPQGAAPEISIGVSNTAKVYKVSAAAGGALNLASAVGVEVNGFPAGHKVPVPANATAAGKPGQWAADSGFIYAYTGDGTAHTWVRSVAAGW
jgi:hypothetical protein